jgi:hypothetical protein
MLAALMIGHRFSISPFTSAASTSGVLQDRPKRTKRQLMKERVL